jgi:hypothetical protein
MQSYFILLNSLCQMAYLGAIYSLKVTSVKLVGTMPKKIETLFNSLQGNERAIRQQLFEVFRDNQDLQLFFTAPNRDLLGFLPLPCLNALKKIATHLYCGTKDLQEVIVEANGISINAHFDSFRQVAVNGNICKACGMNELAAFRAGVPGDEQWRSDYDHQLCKSKYPIFAVHPENLVPLCDVCNQDAKKAKNLFQCSNGVERLAFYPFAEEARAFVDIDIDQLRDPEPSIKVIWVTQDDTQLNKLDTWDRIYEIRSRVEGQFRSLEVIVEDEINPRDLAHLQTQIDDKSRPVPEVTLKRKEWSFWYQKLFNQLNTIDLAPFWEKSKFVQEQGVDGGEYILAG